MLNKNSLFELLLFTFNEIMVFKNDLKDLKKKHLKQLLNQIKIFKILYNEYIESINFLENKKSNLEFKINKNDVDLLLSELKTINKNTEKKINILVNELAELNDSVKKILGNYTKGLELIKNYNPNNKFYIKKVKKYINKINN